MTLPPCTCFTSILASYLPEQILMNAILSLCALFIFACILNTNAENACSVGDTRPISALLESGVVVIFKKCCKKNSTPKFVSAEPKNTGVSSPARTSSKSNSALAPSKSAISSSRRPAASSPIAAQSASASFAITSLASPSLVPFSVSE